MLSPAARLHAAFAALKERRFEEARDELEALVREELADAVVWETLGDVRDKLGNEAGAVEAWRLAATAWLARQQVPRARAVLELLLLLRPDDEEALESLKALQGQGV